MKKKNVYDILKERGFIKQVTDEDEVRELLERQKISCYIGFDPTADSLHAGSLMPIMALVHMQREGHHPIAILGAGTAMVGDPSGKTEMRKMLLEGTIKENGKKIEKQLNRYLHFDKGSASIVNNADWLLELNYVSFLREIGRHFSVNRMLAAESYRIRMETGLSFLEFNYQLLQAYDFLVLFRQNKCVMQMGGDDQWGNIVAGIDLIRRLESQKAYGVTFPLLETAGGQKMGKTAKGALWLDAERTTPYDFYQYWINVDDRDVKRFLAYFTLLPMSEVERLGKLQGAEIREAKQVLAFEATEITHGKEEAEVAQSASQSAFGGSTRNDLDGMPTMNMEKSYLDSGISVIDLFEKAGLVSSKSDARRLIKQGGCYVNDERVEDIEFVIDRSIVVDNYVVLRAGKKRYCRVLFE